MRTKTIVSSFATLAAVCFASQAAQAASDAKGVWMNDTGRGAIEIKDCGGKLCGHVVWTRDEGDASRGCGKQIIGDAVSVGSGLWDNGWIYSPDKKRRYDVELKPLSDGTLRVKGYAGSKFFSKTMIWKPAPADLQRCDAANIEAKAVPQVAPSKPAETASIAKAPVATPAPAATEAAKIPAPAANTPASSATPAPAAAEVSKAQAPAKDVVQPKPAEAKPAAVAAPEQAPQQEPEPQVAEADEAGADMPDNLGDLVDKLDGKEFGDGYGLKKVGNGDCRVKLPYVNITVPCKK